MFGNLSGTFLAPRHQDIPLHLIFSLERRGGRRASEQQVEQPTCVRVDEPQGPRQQGADHEGRKRDAHHRGSVLHIDGVCGNKAGDRSDNGDRWRYEPELTTEQALNKSLKKKSNQIREELLNCLFNRGF